MTKRSRVLRRFETPMPIILKALILIKGFLKVDEEDCQISLAVKGLVYFFIGKIDVVQYVLSTDIYCLHCTNLVEKVQSHFGSHHLDIHLID